jgi:bacteriocin-like protein
MASIKISDLCPSDSDLSVNSESFLNNVSKSDLEELSESDLATINGGFVEFFLGAWLGRKTAEVVRNYPIVTYPGGYITLP